MATVPTNVSNPGTYRLRRTIFTTLSALAALRNVSVVTEPTHEWIAVKNSYRFIPDFQLFWAEDYKYFRGYIYMVPEKHLMNKSSAGYCAFTSRSVLVAMLFTTVYGFFHKNRANQG